MLNQAVQERAGAGFMESLCAFALDRRRACYLIAIALAALCCFTSEWAQVRENPDAFLPKDSETRQGLEVMRTEFADLQTERILVENVSAPQAKTLAEKLSLASGVQSADFDERSGYRTGSALLKVTFRDEGGASDTRKALSELRFLLEGYDYSIVGDTGGLSVNGELWLITAAVCAALLVAAALFVQVPAVTEVSVIALTFGAAFLFNSGTWFLSGAISPVAAYLSGLSQLALCVVCVGPLFRRCAEARARMSTREAVIEAWSRTAPGALGGGAFMVCALIATNLLRLRIGADPGFIIAKAAALTLIAFVALTPGLLADLCEPLDRTPSRETEKNSSGLSNFAEGSRFLMPFVLIAALIASGICAAYLPRAYGPDALPIWFPWGNQRAEGKAEALFGSENELSILVPAGDASRESALLDELSAMDEVSAARGLANMETMGGYTLGERLTPRQFAELMDLDLDAARQIYSAYIEAADAYGHLAAGVDNAAIPLAEMLLFACDRAREGYITLDWGPDNALELLYKRTEGAVRTMRGANYSRLTVTLSVPEGNAKSFAFLYTLRNAVGRYYPQGVLFAGDAVRDADLSTAFHHDRLLFAALILSIAFVVLYALTGSAGIAILSALAAQCGAWITLSIFLLAGSNLYFLADFLIAVVQIGFALIFAALLTERWAERKRDTESRTALLRALRDASRSLMASSVVIALACVAAGALTGNRAVSSLALCMGAGIWIAALLTLLTLPQTFLLLPESAIKSAPDAATAKKSAPDTAKARRARTQKVRAAQTQEVREAQTQEARAAQEETFAAAPELTGGRETVAAAEASYKKEESVTADGSEVTEVLEKYDPSESEEGGARAYLRELLDGAGLKDEKPEAVRNEESNAGSEAVRDEESNAGSEAGEDGSEAVRKSREKEASGNESKDV